MEKFHCIRCGKFLGELVKGKIRNGAVMICRECLEIYKLADDIASMKHKQMPADMPEFFKGIFNTNSR